MVEKSSLFLFARIYKTEEGEWELCLEVREVLDKLTPLIFLKKKNGTYEIRKATEEGLYEKPKTEEGETSTNYAFFRFKSYEEAIKGMESILNAIKQEREKIIKHSEKPREFYIHL